MYTNGTSFVGSGEVYFCEWYKGILYGSCVAFTEDAE